MDQKVTEIGVFEYCQGKYAGYYFKAKKVIKLFSQDYEINLTINVYDEGPEGFTDEMVMATKTCLDTINQTDKVEQAIKKYYNESIRYTLEEDLEIDDINEFARLIQPYELYVTSFKIGLAFECVWDEEEGIGISFDREGNITEIAGTGVVY